MRSYFIAAIFFCLLPFGELSAVEVSIPAGRFRMGRNGAALQNQGPAFWVNLKAFRIDETLVTFAAFRRFTEETKYTTTAEKLGHALVALEGMGEYEWTRIVGANWRFPYGKDKAREWPMQDDFPVTAISWSDADAYCRHYGKRLPTEAEWEYAMRAGSQGTRFPWGNATRDKNGKYLLNYWQGRDHTHNPNGDGYMYLSPVKAFLPNRWGIYDTVGNVWQYTADWYGQFTADEKTNPQGPATGVMKVARGGSWWCSFHSCDAFGLYYRGKSLPDAPFSNNGFRCAAD
ncbi:MAG: SUMF1/EgtB/PvdO family nonheme iron enzyme [Spirochaetes bacterium]|nr:SUMF1/EgtB/PvdO family nonheme iron enzyme [Spirochaetota bacterium]